MKTETRPKVFFVILNFNAGEILRDCLVSVFQQDYPNFEVILVDNGSTDGSFEAAKQSFSRTHFIRSEKNVGFAAGNNLGIRYALEKMADYVFLLNPDATVRKDALSSLIAHAEQDRQIGALSPLILKGDGHDIWFSGGKIDWLRMRAWHLTEDPAREAPYETEYLSGCALLIRKEVFLEVSLLDEDYFLYYEDTDLSWRIRQAGFKLQIVPRSQVIHWEQSQGNLEKKTYWLVFSGLIFFRKNSPLILRFWQTVYLWGRKLKNRIRLWNRSDVLARSSKDAYNDYSLWKSRNRHSPS